MGIGARDWGVGGSRRLFGDCALEYVCMLVVSTGGRYGLGLRGTVGDDESNEQLRNNSVGHTWLGELGKEIVIIRGFVSIVIVDGLYIALWRHRCLLLLCEPSQYLVEQLLEVLLDWRYGPQTELGW